jgi:hypothetical protein
MNLNSGGALQIDTTVVLHLQTKYGNLQINPPMQTDKHSANGAARQTPYVLRAAACTIRAAFALLAKP